MTFFSRIYANAFLTSCNELFTEFKRLAKPLDGIDMHFKPSKHCAWKSNPYVSNIFGILWYIFDEFSFNYFGNNEYNKEMH